MFPFTLQVHDVNASVVRNRYIRFHLQPDLKTNRIRVQLQLWCYFF